VLELDPNHTNAQNRYEQAQQQVQHKPVAQASPKARPRPAVTLSETNPQIVKGAGGTTVTKRRFQIQPVHWWGGGVALAAVIIGLLIFSGLWSDSLAANSSAIFGNPTTIGTVVFNGQIFAKHGTRYLTFDANSIEIIQGDMVVQTLTTSATIHSKGEGRVVTSEYGLVGVRYDTGSKRLIVHCLRGQCVAGGDEATQKLLRGQAISVNEQGELGDLFEANYNLFSFAPIVQTPTP
jgi:uncharacterized membrane protein YgdD (TMEM256/DUF423 family)